MKLSFATFILLFNFISFASEEININFKNLKIMELIKITSKIIDKNILLTKDIKGTVDFISSKPLNNLINYKKYNIFM